jgi:hypothetical protein
VTQEPPEYPTEPIPPTTGGGPQYGSQYGQAPSWPPPPPTVPAVPVYFGYPPQAPQPQSQPSSGLYVAAAVINWIVLGLLILGTCGIGIVAAAWYIPMTVFIHKGARDPYKHTALGVCTLLFCNIISGILMLVEDGKRQPRP